MAKRRERPVENPLRRDLISAVTGPASPAPSSSSVAEEDAPEPVGQGRVERPTPRAKRKRPYEPGAGAMTEIMKTRFVPGEHEDNARLAHVVGSLVGCRVDPSHVTRALWSLVRRAEEEMVELSPKAPRLKRPAYGDRLGVGEYEDALANFILAALKRIRKE